MVLMQQPVNAAGTPACQTVDEVRSSVPLGADSRRLAASVSGVDDLIAQLHAHKLDVDTMRVLAYTLPIRQSIWWALLCAWHGLDGKPGAEQNMALQAATRWVLAPTVGWQRTAAAIANARDLREASDCCVRAASVAGHVEKPDGPFIQGNVALAARMVLAAVFLAYSQRIDRSVEVSYRRLARLGLLVKEGTLPFYLQGV